MTKKSNTLAVCGGAAANTTTIKRTTFLGSERNCSVALFAGWIQVLDWIQVQSLNGQFDAEKSCALDLFQSALYNSRSLRALSQGEGVYSRSYHDV